MADGNGTDVVGATAAASGVGGTRADARFALVIGLLLGGALVAIAQSALPALMTPASKTEDRLAATADSQAEDAAACTALVQDRVTGATVALDCGRAIPPPATRRSREIES